MIGYKKSGEAQTLMATCEGQKQKERRQEGKRRLQWHAIDRSSFQMISHKKRVARGYRHQWMLVFWPKTERK